MENILDSLNVRTGQFGVERKNIVNSLFKRIIDVLFPNFVKYLFWSATVNKGIFEDYFQPNGQITVKQRNRMSKYQVEELRAVEAFEEWEDINQLLELSPEQHHKIKMEQ